MWNSPTMTTMEPMLRSVSVLTPSKRILERPTALSAKSRRRSRKRPSRQQTKSGNASLRWLTLLATVSRLTFERTIAGDHNGEEANAALEADERKLASLHEQLAPLQTEINQLTRQFWVGKDQVKAHKYDLSASRYRQVERDEQFYEKPQLTLERLRQLETATIGEIAALREMLAKP
jgi:hypothetical protein